MEVTILIYALYLSIYNIIQYIEPAIVFISPDRTFPFRTTKLEGTELEKAHSWHSFSTCLCHGSKAEEIGKLGNTIQASLNMVSV